MTVRRRCRIGLESLERLQLPSTLTPHAALIGDLNSDGRVDLADERILVAAFGSKVGSPNYNPAADLTGNGFVGQGDGRVLLRDLSAPPAKKGRLVLDLGLDPADQVRLPHSASSGGVTRHSDVTIIGRTVPNSLIFTDPAAADYSFSGPAFVADDQGFFQQRVHLKDALTNFQFLAVSPSGQQTIRSFPIRDNTLVYSRH